MDDFTKTLETEVLKVFEPNGLLDANLPHYEYRHQQSDMARGVARAITLGKVLAVEAPTGVGKSFAYLVPVMLQRRKSVVATLTKALMHQLYDKDIPFLIEKLGLYDLQVALLKGRANYLCLARLNDNRRLRETLFEEPKKLEYIFQWSRKTQTGDFVETKFQPNEFLIRELGSSPDTCPGRKCKFFGECWYFRALKEAQEADLVVTNQHLLCSALAAGSPFPSPEATVIIDEAHSLDEVARASFGQEISSVALRIFIREVNLLASKTEAREAQAMKKIAGNLADRFNLLCISMIRGASAMRVADPGQVEEQEKQELQAIADALESIAALAKPLEKQDLTPVISDWATNLQSAAAVFLDFTDSNLVHLLERDQRGFVMSTLPIMVGEYLQEHMYPMFPAMVLTSATLTVQGKLRFLRQKLGLPENTEVMTLKSPFNLKEQAVLFVPKGFPEPNKPDFIDAFAELALSIIHDAGGRTFLLFTSHRNLQGVYERLEPLLGVPVLKQGDGPKEKLIERFKTLGNAVLFGSMTFWQGVDVMGSSLSVVMIDKLPFPSPANPIVEARSALLAAQGRRDFWEWSVPETAMTLKQGFGRLIRSKTDKGAVVITDVRLLTRSYGRTFLSELPAVPLLLDRQELLNWMRGNLKGV